MRGSMVLEPSQKICKLISFIVQLIFMTSNQASLERLCSALLTFYALRITFTIHITILLCHL